MLGWLQTIVNAIYLGFTFLANVVRNLVQSGLTGIWQVVEYSVEFIWNHTILIAYTTLGALLDNMGLLYVINLASYLQYVEAANYWLPITEAVAISKALYAFYFWAFTYRWIKWAVPFL